MVDGQMTEASNKCEAYLLVVNVTFKRHNLVPGKRYLYWARCSVAKGMRGQWSND